MARESELQEQLAKLQEEYDQLERDFDNMSEGYQDSLLLYDKLEESYRELEETNRKLDIARMKAEESSRMKSIFIQQISHEIRTPLSILSGFTQVVTTPGMELDDETKADISRQFLENTNRITRLVDKMLELSDAGCKIVIERNDQAAAIEIAAEAVEASGISAAPHLDFNMTISPEAEAVVLTTNRQSAVRALTLVLGNALKFTKPAEAYARHDIPKEKKQASLLIDVNDQMVRFVVEDTGIGIPAEEAEHVFEEFVQLDNYYDGTGIGLTVARSLARRLGGDIVLDTSYTAGARFVITLPKEN